MFLEFYAVQPWFINSREVSRHCERPFMLYADVLDICLEQQKR